MKHTKGPWKYEMHLDNKLHVVSDADGLMNGEVTDELERIIAKAEGDK